MGVNFSGFHPKSCRYSPICFLEPRLKGFRTLRIKGSMQPDSMTLVNSSSVNPTLDKLPSFFSLGVTSFTSTHLGLKFWCTAHSSFILVSFRSASRSIECLKSSNQPFLVCFWMICCTSCSKSMDSLLNFLSSSFSLS